jgi:molecular chaperone DnaK
MGDINKAIENLKKAMEGDNAEEIKRLADELTQSSHKLAETMYSKASQQQAPGGGGAGSGGAGSGGAGSGGAGPRKDEDVVDADFEEVKK